jgi:periplasmic mercuric ion binding protein
MKLLLSFLLISIASLGFAQTKTETFKVAGECGSCKKKIESAAKKAGASYAAWNIDSKELIIKYNSTSTNTAKIQKAIAAVGYDTPDYKASDDAYNKLDDCCQYERTGSKEKSVRDSKAGEDKKG